jgi:hypothetical protein
MKLDDNNVFFIYPTIKKNTAGQEFVLADHMTFPLRKQDEIHLHVTTYVPHPFNMDTGFVSHTPRNEFKNGAVLPITGYNDTSFLVSTFKNMGTISNQVCRKYKQWQQVAGGPNRKLVTVKKTTQNKIVIKTKAKVTVKSKPTVPKRNQISLKLAQLLVKKKIKSVVAFGHKSPSSADNKWYITTNIQRMDQNVDYSGFDTDYVITLLNPTFGNFSNKLYKLLNT